MKNPGVIAKNYPFPILILLTITLFTNPLFSLTDSGTPSIKNYSSKEYKSHAQNWAVVQDPRGIIYVANKNGILEFDGSNWSLIPVANQSTVRSLAVDKKGMIYAGANGDFGYLAIDRLGKLTYISLAARLGENEKNFKDIWSIHIIPEGIYFIATNSYFRWHNHKLTRGLLPSAGRAGFTVGDQIFIPLLSGGIMTLSGDSCHQLPQTEQFKNSTHGRILVLPYKSTHLMIVTAKKGLYLYHLAANSDRLKKNGVRIEELKSPVRQFLLTNNIYSATAIDRQTYALGTIRGGILFIDDGGRILQVIDKARGLRQNLVSGLWLDHSRNLWVTSNNGLSYIEYSSPLTSFNEKSGLDGVVLTSIKYGNAIYAGTFTGVFYLDTGRAGNNPSARFKPVIHATEQCFVLHRMGNILLAGGNGVFQIHGDRAKKLVSGRTVMCFGQSNKFPDVVFAGSYPGLSAIQIRELDPESKNPRIHFRNIGPVFGISEIIRRIATNQDGDLFLTTQYQGIIHIKFNGKTLADYQKTSYGMDHGLPQLDNNNVTTIQSHLVVATRKGFYLGVPGNRSDPDGEPFHFIPESTFGEILRRQSLAVEFCVEDSLGNIWVATGEGGGILRKTGTQKYVWDTTPFRKVSGQISHLFVGGKGIGWICTSEGLYRYDPEKRKEYDDNYQSLIRRVVVNGDQVIFYGTQYNPDSASGEFYTEASLVQPDQLVSVLPFNKNSISFKFTAVFYEHQEFTHYQYMLEGFDKDWSAWNQRTEKEYTNLPHGEYCFKVRARNIFDTESAVSQFEFIIDSPWYFSWWALTLFVFLIAAVLYVILALNSRRLVAAKRRLEEIVHQRTAEVERQKEQLLVTNRELEKLSIVARETDNAVVIMDAKGYIEWVNDGFTRIYGDTLEQLKEERGKNLVDVSTNPNIKELLDSCIHDHKTTIYDSLIVTREGEKKWAQTTLTPVLDERGETLKVVVIESDITKVKEAEEAAEHANQSKSDFLARMSHEIRTPMNGIIGFTDMLLDTDLDDEQADYAKTINRSGEALLSLLNDILDLSKIEAGKLTFDPIEFDPEVTLFDICELIKPRLSRETIELFCLIDDNVPGFVRADAGRFRQVILNLMGNAAKFTEEGQIEVKLTIEDENEGKIKLHTQVRDTGIGIEKEKLEVIFNAFQQADGSTTRKYGGTGLGLSICKQIAQMMGGEVWAESQVGQGSIFHFTCWVENVDKAPARVFSSKILQGKRVLIVDDHPLNLDILTHYLEMQHMSIVAARNGKIALQEIQEAIKKNNLFDICIVDIQMPGFSGYDLADAIRKLPGTASKMPLLAFSSSTTVGSKKFKEAGFDGFLPKPTQRNKLLLMLERLLNKDVKDLGEEETKIITQHSIIEETKHSVNILLAEDNPINQKLALFMLKKAGYQVTVVNNGQEAIDIFLANPDAFNLILMDIQMPEIDGKEATRILREKGFTNIPIVAMTAEAMKGDRENCLRAGMDDYIPKPIKREAVFKAVRKFVIEKSQRF